MLPAKYIYTRAEEKALIEETTIQNNDNPWYGISGGQDTKDMIFLLSIEEVVKYFGDSGQLKNRPAEYAYYINDQYNSARIAKNAYGNALWWWLRSPGSHSDGAAYVSSDGEIYVLGFFVKVSNFTGGTRPALWLNLDVRLP